jgi:hypothetical protein
VLYAGLLHDAGVAVAELPANVDGNGGHASAGAWVASHFGLDTQVQHTLASTHEHWDGGGRPHGTAGEDVAVEARVINAAHWASDIAEGSESPLCSRAALQKLHPRDVT